jgi:23S rRNA pseudouridine1911/1915/1917 synthase
MTDPEILLEDENIVVFNKPSGLVVNLSKTYSEETLQDFLKHKYSDLWKETPEEDGTMETEDEEGEYKSDFLGRNGIVHRLDKNTSGVLVVAKNERSFLNIQKQFKKRSVKKFYTALVFGKFEEKNIEIDAPIGRNPKTPFKFAVVTDGKPAKTIISVDSDRIIEDKAISKVNIEPESGRTHQIRVHLSALSHPVVNDEVYGSSRDFEWSDPIFKRLMLHATRLEFTHPVTGEQVKIESKLPQEFDIFTK